MLKEAFTNSASLFNDSQSRIEDLWKEILTSYSETNRYYHNLSHLENMLSELNAVKREIKDWAGIVMALFYHDIVYKATASDNEEKSANKAKARLKELKFPDTKIEHCHKMILATKGHTISSDADINIFTDADLSILGKPWDVYQQYFENIRKEYSVYPDFLYSPGRKKVLKHFLSMPRIYKTDHFYDLYEENAKLNLNKELTLSEK